MAKGSWTATAVSAQIVAANRYREVLFIQKTNATAIALGIGEAAEVGEGVQLVNVGDVVILRGALARHAVCAIGDGGAGAFQDGDVDYHPGPHVTV